LNYAFALQVARAIEQNGMVRQSSLGSAPPFSSHPELDYGAVPAESAKWYRESDDQKNVDAAFCHALSVHYGIGVDSDPEEAQLYYDLGAIVLITAFQLVQFVASGSAAK
jgi:TPR repeat protein